MIWASARRRDHIGYPAHNLPIRWWTTTCPSCTALTTCLKMVAEVRFERTSLAYETKLEPSPVYSAINRYQKWFRQMESNHLPIGYQPIARPESLAGMEPAPGIEPRIGRLPCGCSAIELHRLEPKRGFELRSGRYKRPVLPIELLRLERVRRIELRWPDWQSGAQPMSHTRQTIGADGDNRKRARSEPKSSCQRTGRGPRIRTGSLLLPGQAG